MSRHLFILVLLAAVIAASVAKSTGKNGSCPKHEVSSPCGRHCEPSCGNPQPSPYACRRQSCTAEMRGCRCKPDLCRNRNGKCVEQEKCKKDR
ncbi:serine protease inhibitor swm-1-like [Andrena cerasifolii]|uniref:serine protease inhibitor swm-1-like n=1 Tax=Andrena cerasifolii TaxID=2819439 RepID=UPI004037F884